MPSAAAFESCPLAVEHLNDLPPFLRDDPDIRAIVYCHAKEAERQEQRLDELLAELFPQSATEVGLPWWETLMRITVEPEGLTVEERRETVIAYLRKLRGEAGGEEWIANVTSLIGPTWSYVEHDPDDPTSSPPPYTVRVSVPFEPGVGEFAATERLIREITPAHLDIELVYSGGFLLDIGELDEQTL